jgi:enoyl-CoA hydratase
MTEIVTYTRHDQYAVIKMDDGKANAFSFEMIRQVNEALDQAEKDGLVVIFTGREGKFCAGFDLTVMRAGGPERERLLKEGFKVSYRLMNWARPVILACSGHALALGGVLLLSCDIRIAEDNDAKLGLNEIAIGVEMPEYGVDLVRERVALPHQIPALANSMLYRPADAVSAGFIDIVVEAGSLMEKAKEFAGNVSQIDMNAHATAKHALRQKFLQKHQEYGEA